MSNQNANPSEPSQNHRSDSLLAKIAPFFRPAELGSGRLLLDNLQLLLRRRRSYEDLLTFPDIPAREAYARRSVIFRHLDCGSCHACELALMRLESPVIDMQKYNIRFEASPRHAYFLVMTGPMTANMAEEAKRTVNAMPIEAVIAFGDCAVDGGIFKSSYAVRKRSEVFPPDLVKFEFPGCPPSPIQFLEKILPLLSASKTRGLQ
ncbi:MAG: hypothetical protein WCF84_11115 [Anaerolineae bacterium]